MNRYSQKRLLIPVTLAVLFGTLTNVWAEEDKDEAKKEHTKNKSHEISKDDPYTHDFDLSKCTLGPTGKNEYFILEPGYQLVLAESKDADAETLTITVLDETRKIGDVETRVVEERETDKGKVTEVSRNFFAFCKETGDIYYFGEETDTYKDGKIARGNDSSIAGTNSAKPGLAMPAKPTAGQRYYQEQAPGTALDRAEVTSTTDTFDTLSGKFENVLKTRESSPLEPLTFEDKHYAPGIGLIQDEELLLLSHGPKK